jgi:hypothetical protein
MSVSDRLYEEHFDNQTKQEMYKREKTLMEVQGNTKKPLVSNYNTQLAINSRKSIALRSLDNDLSKWDHLYLDAGRYRSKRDKDTDEKDFEKNKD